MHNNSQWMPTEGVIVDVQPAHGRHEHHFTIEFRKFDGALIRQVVRHKVQAPYSIGSTVKIQLKDNEIRFDPNYPGDAAIVDTISMSDQIQQAAAAFDRPGMQGPNFGAFDGMGSGTVIMGGANVGAFLGALGGPGASVQMLGPDGQPVQFDSSEFARLTQAIMSGSPSEREAAKVRLLELRETMQANAAAGFTGGTMIPPGTVIQHGSPEQRLQALQQLYDKGLLNETEYENKRQQIINGI